jgi:hypothetical protein
MRIAMMGLYMHSAGCWSMTKNYPSLGRNPEVMQNHPLLLNSDPFPAIYSAIQSKNFPH